MDGESPPGSLSEGAGSPQGLTEGVSFDEWYKPKSSEFRRDDENRPKPRILASTRMNGESQNHQSFVGAMKIARNVAVFEW